MQCIRDILHYTVYDMPYTFSNTFTNTNHTHLYMYRFKDCTKLLITCHTCHNESEFKGTDASSYHLNCIHCGALHLGHNSARDLYTYFSNKVTLLVRTCLKRYYDCWLICDESTCHRRTMQQPG